MNVNLKLKRKRANYSRGEIFKFQQDFLEYDKDESGTIEREELSNLIADLGIELRKAEDQKRAMQHDNQRFTTAQYHHGNFLFDE